jgi:YegS/Rv2252/BmrU family lipid kinase
VLFIINPVSGVRRKNNIPELIENYLDSIKFEYSVAFTEYSGHAHELAKNAITNNYNIVCAIGGDGSVHEVGTALIGTDKILAIIPAGSGNGLARHLSIPLRLKDSIFIINQMKVRKIDVGQVNDFPFLNAAGFGFDAHISACFSRFHARGLWSYIRLIIKEYFFFKEQDFTYQLDGKEKLKSRDLMCSVTNASEFGNGFCISPFSSVHDGKMELILLKKFPWIIGPFVAKKFFNRKPHTSRYVKIKPFHEMEISLTSETGHVDGEPIKLSSPVKVSVNKNALNVIVGENYA